MVLLPGCGCCQTSSGECDCASHAPYYIEYGTKSSWDYRCGLPANWKTTWCGYECDDSHTPYYFTSNTANRACNAVGVKGEVPYTNQNGDYGWREIGINMNTDYPATTSTRTSQELGNKFRSLQLGWWETDNMYRSDFRYLGRRSVGVELSCSGFGVCGGKLLRAWRFYAYIDMIRDNTATFPQNNSGRLRGYSADFNVMTPFFSQSCVDGVYDSKCNPRSDWRCCTLYQHLQDFHMPVPVQFTLNSGGISVAHTGTTQFFPWVVAEASGAAYSDTFFAKEWQFTVKAAQSCHLPANCSCGVSCDCNCSSSLNVCCNPLP